MGLDATVRCTCYEKGLLKPGPVPYEDLYIDEEGYLSSRTLDDAHGRYDFRQYNARFGELEDAFRDWLDHSCEHEDGDLCWERIGNIAGCSAFHCLLDEAGGEEAFPLLANMLPEGNGGMYPAELAKSTLEELERFFDKLGAMNKWAVCDTATNEVVWTGIPHSRFTWRYGSDCTAGMVDDKVFFLTPGNPPILTQHFKEIPLEPTSYKGYQKTRIICLDTEASFELSSPFGYTKQLDHEREFAVVSRPVLTNGYHPTVEALRRLLTASMETGNPIRWC